MDRRNYDVKTIGIFDTIGSYFIDVFYNNHYLMAKGSVSDGRATSITDAYRANVLKYMNGIAARPDLYMTVVKKLHEYYQRTSGFGSIVFSDFEDKMLSQFIPPDYYKDFSEKHKDQTLREIIVKTVNELGEIVVGRDMLKRIIDDHMNKMNVTYLQDRIVEIFIIQREDYYERFAKEISKKNGNDKVDKDVVNKLKQIFIEEKKKRLDLEDDKERAVNMISQLLTKIKSLEDELTSAKDNLRRMNDRINSMVERRVENPPIDKSTNNMSTKNMSTKNATVKNTSAGDKGTMRNEQHKSNEQSKNNEQPKSNERNKREKEHYETESDDSDDSNESNNESDNNKSGDDSGYDSEEVYRRQKEKLAAKFADNKRSQTNSPVSNQQTSSMVASNTTTDVSIFNMDDLNKDTW